MSEYKLIIEEVKFPLIDYQDYLVLRNVLAQLGYGTWSAVRNRRHDSEIEKERPETRDECLRLKGKTKYSEPGFQVNEP